MGNTLEQAIRSSLSAIRDQRSMVGDRIHLTVDDVEAGWLEWIGQHGLPIRRRAGDYSTDLRESRKKIVAYVSGGKWIADCPTCNGGVACWSENPRGACLDCGTIYRIDHPSPEERNLVETLLTARPRVEDRSWLRHRGEKPDNLRRENELLAQTREDDGLDTYTIAEVEQILGRRAASRLRKAAG